jgi:hypothetical protein
MSSTSGLPGGADGGEAEAVRHGEATEDGLQEVAGEVGLPRPHPLQLAHRSHLRVS